MSSAFVNTLPYISHPIEEFGDYRFVNWEQGIYPKFKGGTKHEEIQFFVDLIRMHNAKSILDLGVGSGSELSGIVERCREQGYGLDFVEANEVEDEFTDRLVNCFATSNRILSFTNRTGSTFPKRRQTIAIHLISRILREIPLRTSGAGPETTQNARSKAL